MIAPGARIVSTLAKGSDFEALCQTCLVEGPVVPRPVEPRAVVDELLQVAQAHRGAGGRFASGSNLYASRLTTLSQHQWDGSPVSGSARRFAARFVPGDSQACT